MRKIPSSLTAWLTVPALLTIGAAACGGHAFRDRDDAGADVKIVKPNWEFGDGRGSEVVWLGPADRPYCYKINAVRDVSDACGLGVADAVGLFVPGDYSKETTVFTLGFGGSLGQGQLVYNDGMLTREGDVPSPTIAGCAWHQRDDTKIRMIGDGTFTASVVEQHTDIAPACGVSTTSCTSSWTLFMSANGERSPSNNCQ